jgi:hypothetical protein
MCGKRSVSLSAITTRRVDNFLLPIMHRALMPFCQVAALRGASAAVAIPSISPRAHKLAAFLHKSSTGSCTEGTSAGSAPRSRQPASLPQPRLPETTPIKSGREVHQRSAPGQRRGGCPRLPVSGVAGPGAAVARRQLPAGPAPLRIAPRGCQVFARSARCLRLGTSAHHPAMFGRDCPRAPEGLGHRYGEGHAWAIV